MRLIAALLGIFLLAASTVFAVATKTYQVTGPLLDVKDDMVVVQKGSEKWEIAKDKDAKVTGELKVGNKVTVTYTMKASTIDVKGPAKAEKKKK